MSVSIKSLTPVVLALNLTLLACATRSPVAPGPLPFMDAPGWHVADYSLPSDQLFSLNPDSAMRRYIAEVLRNNPDLKSITASLRAASHSVDAARADRWPQMHVSLSARRGRDTLRPDVSNSVTAILDADWNVDLWGMLADELEAAAFIAAKSTADLQQTQRLIVNQSAHNWIEYWGYVRAEKDLLALDRVYTNLRDHFQESYAAGLIPYAVFLDAKNSQKLNLDRLQTLQLEKLMRLHVMNTLRGQFPGQVLNITDYSLSPQLLRFGGEIPATALANRPDIQAAFSELQAFNHSARAAHRALLPQIELTGSTLKTGSSLEKALKGDLIWQLVGGLTQPLFNAGQLNAYAKQKSAEAEASWWQFQKIVLQAMLEVEQAIASEHSINQQLAQKTRAFADLTNRKRSAQERFGDGALPLADFLQIKAEHIEAKNDLTETQVGYIKNRFKLGLALGLSIENKKKR